MPRSGRKERDRDPLRPGPGARLGVSPRRLEPSGQARQRQRQRARLRLALPRALDGGPPAPGRRGAVCTLLATRASGSASGPAFVWLYSALSTVIFAPLAAGVFIGGGRLGALGLLFVFGTGALHIGYFLLLQKGYQVGDLSVVYLLARGTGPLLASGAAILFLGERAGPVAWTGILLIVAGVFLLAYAPGGGGGAPAQRGLGGGL